VANKTTKNTPPVENFSTNTPSNVENSNKPLYYLTKTPDKLPSNCGKPCGTVENNCGKAPSNPLKIPLKTPRFHVTSETNRKLSPVFPDSPLPKIETIKVFHRENPVENPIGFIARTVRVKPPRIACDAGSLRHATHDTSLSEGG
jgi:hypothetical protein